MNIAIIGAGIAGLSASYDLLDAGHSVTLFEASSTTGGLARGFRDDTWDWSLEHFYHHLFETDSAIIGLVEELGIRDQLFFPTPKTSIYDNGKIYPFSNPVDWWKFPGFDPISYARFGFVGVFLRYTKFWERLEKVTANEWTRTYYGKKTHKLIWEPLLISKFGPHYKEANMAWLWARLHVRSFKLGYFTGGFEAFTNQLTTAVTQKGGEIRLNTPVESVQTTDDGRLTIGFQGETIGFDRVLHTTSPQLLATLAPQLPPAYTQKLTALKHMGAVVLTLALKQPFLTDGTYWLNVPANTPDKMDTDTPFVGLFEHTNYVDPKHYGGDHILYCGDYITPDHPYMTMSKTEIEDRFTSALTKFNPAFRKEWIRKSWLHKASYAQPIPTVNHSQNILPMQTPISGLYMANMSQVYPWDRGTNFAVEIGRRAARILLEETE